MTSGPFDATAITRSPSGTHITTASWPTSPPPPAAASTVVPATDASSRTHPGVSAVPSPWSTVGRAIAAVDSGDNDRPVNNARVHAARSGIVIATSPLPVMAQCGPGKSPRSPVEPSSSSPIARGPDAVGSPSQKPPATPPSGRRRAPDTRASR